MNLHLAKPPAESPPTLAQSSVASRRWAGAARGDAPLLSAVPLRQRDLGAMA